MSGFQSEKMYASNGKIMANTYIINAIEQGTGFAALVGHVNTISGSTHPFDNENLWIQQVVSKAEPW